MAIDRDKVLQAAQKYVEKKKYDKAVVEYRKLIEADPNDARTWLKIGDLQAKQSLHGEAISTYEAVGKLYVKQGLVLKAIAVYQQIREIIAQHVPELEKSYEHIAPKLAELYQQLGLTSEALAVLDEVASRLQHRQQDQEAIDVFRKIVELDPTSPLARLRLAEALSRVGDVQGAVFEFKTAAAQLIGIGRRDDAIKVIERLLHHKVDAEQARLCAELYLSRGEARDGMLALAKLQICFQANPRDTDTLTLLARAFDAIGQSAKAIEVQKEMARVARDAGKKTLFRETVEHLLRTMPNDEAVRKLGEQLANITGEHVAYGAIDGATGNENAPNENAPNENALAPVSAIERPIVASADSHLPQSAPQSATLTRSRSAARRPDKAEKLAYEEPTYEEIADDEVIEETDSAHAIGADIALTGESTGKEAHESLSDLVTSHGDNAGSAELTGQLQKVIDDANAFRRVHLYGKALDTLRTGLTIDPLSMDVHAIYRDVLIEAGENEQAVNEMLVIASLYVDSLDGESAVHALEDVLAFDPENTRAIDLLHELGYEIVNDKQDELANFSASDKSSAGTDAPLPAYDIDEVRASKPGLNALKVPGDSLPSFPLDGADTDPGDELETLDDSEYAFEEEVTDDGRVEATPLSSLAENLAEPPDSLADLPADSPAGLPPAASPSLFNQDLEDALDEAEFFCSRGLFDDARATIADQQSRYPNHPLLLERLAEIDALEAQRGSGAREKPRANATTASSDALDGLADSEVPSDSPSTDRWVNEDANQDHRDVDDVFSKFKQGVAAQISVEDSDSHYNLGIAYKEMMLVDDAIRELEVASRDPNRECVCRSMIGTIEIERGNLNEAILAFVAGLNAKVKDPQQEAVLCFELGAAYEAKKMNKEALAYYQKAMRRDPNYRDVQERVRRLTKNDSKAPVRQAAVGADDEFDRAFADLVSK
ncbi:MAG: tetratricopeptide repeat protein [Polyangiaceae bacterium]|nr:tetratricopeptide repeat protein [Polyangiaceae bacterium]